MSGGIPPAPDLSGLSEKIAASRAVQAAWEALPYRDRAEHLQKSFRYLGAHLDELIEAICRDSGKLPLDALSTELVPALMALDYYIRRGRRFCRGRRISGGNPLMFNKRSRLVYRAQGVVGIISPWNYPFAIPFSEAVMALLAGNAVFLKVASGVPAVGRALEAVFGAAELPPGLFNHVEMPGAEAGPGFIKGGVDKLFFTGSTAVGRELMALAAPRLLPLVLELGGADAAIICEDADLDRAAGGLIWAAFSNAGQSCGGVQRILAHQNIYRPLLEKLRIRIAALRPGVDLGPLYSLQQKERLEEQVASCLAQGAQVAARSPAEGFPEERFFPATLLSEVNPGMPIMAEEVFGPVAAITPVKNDSEALRLANASDYGLTGSVWSQSPIRARRVASGIRAGAVMINDHLMSHGLAETPWGGPGLSGLGRTHGELGFREMQQVQVIVDDSIAGAKNPWWYPYSETVYSGMHAIAEFLGDPGPLRRLTALPRVLRMFFRG
ncbi:MAG: aldehyde dehydrogenase family protein [Spirochaetaceae bacterium]|jgi:succinate-semialdehyde dehydrogenase/glutarate-semialdehyde dehydrogenase|nr:aldehyde dehydrogenase family protein [Spirochaetaceae bacterium]